MKNYCIVCGTHDYGYIVIENNKYSICLDCYKKHDEKSLKEIILNKEKVGK
jgi:hypothetical protein